MPNEGKNWVDAATDVQREQQEIHPQLKGKLSNAIRADLITFGIPAEVVKAQIEFSFPKQGQKPSIRFAIKDSAEKLLSRGIKEQINEYVAQKTEGFNSEFCNLKRNTPGLSVAHTGGYLRSGVTISASSTTDLINGVAAMMTNPLIKSALQKDVGVTQLGG